MIGSLLQTLSAAGGGTSHRIQDADNDTHVEVELTPDEDKIRLTVFGTLRLLLQTASPHAQLTGDLGVSGHIAAGSGASILPSAGINVNETTTAVSYDGMNNIARTSGTTSSLRGVTGEAQVQAGHTGALSYVRGLEFRASHVGAGVVTDLIGAQALVQGSGPATNRIAVKGRIDQMIATATEQIAVFAEVVVNATITVPTSRAFATNLLIQRATLTDFAHYRVGPQLAFVGGGVTDHYGFINPGLTLGANRRPFWDAGVGGVVGDNHGNRFRTNTAFGTVAVAGLFGGGDGVIHIANATVAPAVNPAAGGILYAAGGVLYWLGPATLTPLAGP